MTRIALVRAPNPSPMTLSGTNSYVIDCGNGEAICIDPGPPIAAHVDALLRQCDRMQCRLALICLTHSHPDHAPAAALLRKRTGAPVAAHAESSFPHQRTLRDADTVRAGDTELGVMDAPGHTFDHLVFYEPREAALFTGDAVLGEGYVVIAPPHGDMRAYQRTLHRLLQEFHSARTIYGGHGDPVNDPAAKLRDYLAHRENREREILDALAKGPKTIPELLGAVYAQTNRRLWPAAARQVLAYLIAFEKEGRVRSHEIDRTLSNDETKILNPEWSQIVGREQARVIESELGAAHRIERLRRYERS